MADQHFVLLGRELRRCDEIVQARLALLSYRMKSTPGVPDSKKRPFNAMLKSA